jgi:hypothetical protein
MKKKNLKELRGLLEELKAECIENDQADNANTLDESIDVVDAKIADGPSPRPASKRKRRKSKK